MDNIIFNHSACKSEPINLMADFREALPQFTVPDVVGVRWSYRNALAKSKSNKSLVVKLIRAWIIVALQAIQHFKFL